MIEGHVAYRLKGMSLLYMAIPNIMGPHDPDGTGNRFEVTPPIVFYQIFMSYCRE